MSRFSSKNCLVSGFLIGCARWFVPVLMAAALAQGCTAKEVAVAGSVVNQSVECRTADLGTRDCPCLGGDQCTFGLFCGADGRCRGPKVKCDPPGALNCECAEGRGCGGGLECVEGICTTCGAADVVA